MSLVKVTDATEFRKNLIGELHKIIKDKKNKNISFNLEKGIKNWIAENNPTYKYK